MKIRSIAESKITLGVLYVLGVVLLLPTVAAVALQIWQINNELKENKKNEKRGLRKGTVIMIIVGLLFVVLWVAIFISPPSTNNRAGNTEQNKDVNENQNKPESEGVTDSSQQDANQENSEAEKIIEQDNQANVEMGGGTATIVPIRSESRVSPAAPTQAPTKAPTQTPTVEPTASSTPAATTSSYSCSGNLYNCSDFATQCEAQRVYNYCVSQGAGDIHDLDRDHDGVACQNNSPC